jgi:hypothetical protein
MTIKCLQTRGCCALKQIHPLQKDKAPDVKIICLDVDGTLLNSQQQLTSRVITAIETASACGIRVRTLACHDQ